MSVLDLDEKKLISQIIMDTHVIEKGITMPITKIGFGVSRLKELTNNIKFYIEKYDLEEPQLQHGISVVKEYLLIHKDYKFKVDKLPSIECIKKFIEGMDVQESDNCLLISAAEYFKESNSSFFDFSNSRSSLRSYSDIAVDENIIVDIIDHCRNTPSACNRQSVRIHLYTGSEDIKKILKIQGGNRGFGHLAKFLIAITFEPSKYFETNERNLGYVDGGMYAMNILYALHAKKLAACILNASHCQIKDVKMREVSKTPPSENFVAFIVGGFPNENIKIAKSHRYELKSIMKNHKNVY